MVLFNFSVIMTSFITIIVFIVTSCRFFPKVDTVYLSIIIPFFFVWLDLEYTWLVMAKFIIIIACVYCVARYSVCHLAAVL